MSLSLVTFRVSRFYISHLTHKTFKLHLQNTLNMSKTTRVHFGVLQKALIFLRYHLHEDLKIEYLTVKDPLILWTELKKRFDHQKTVILPKARYDWMHLRLQDFKTVSEYNSALFKISSQLKFCGENITEEDMLE